MQLGMALSRELRGGEVLTLVGDLGAGKTCLVRGLAQGLGISEEEVTSPTFTVIQEYRSQPTLVHVDLYRLESGREIDDIGLSSYFDHDYVVVIEWADRLTFAQLPLDRLELHLTHKSRYTRGLHLRAFGTRSQDLLHDLLDSQRK